MVSSATKRAQFAASALFCLMVTGSLWFLLTDYRPFTEHVTEHVEIDFGRSREDIIASSTYNLPPPPPVLGRPHDKPLILYAYSESEGAARNLDFFLRHALHANADFVFILNGESAAATSLIKELASKAANVHTVIRPNDCYDLGAYAEVLTYGNLWKNYKRFIMLNASLRGPFIPHWAESCWSERYLNKITDEVKLVGMTANCWPSFHVQSMIWAIDQTGLEALLFPQAPISTNGSATAGSALGINACFHDWGQAVAAEVAATGLIHAAGYKVDVMMSMFHSDTEYIAHCDSSENGDVLRNKKYGVGVLDGSEIGTNVSPFETIFFKTNRDVDPVGIEILTRFVDQSGYSSYDYC